MTSETGKGTMKNSSSDTYSRAALFEAAELGNYERISHILSSVEKGGLRQERYYSFKHALTPLHIAALNGHHKCLEILIEYGANLDARDEFSSTALHKAAEKGHYLCLKALLQAGSDFSLPISRRFSGKVPSPYLRGTTALHLAAKNNHVNCVEELLSFGADYNAVDAFGQSSLYLAAKAGLDKCLLAHLRHPHCIDILSLPNYDTLDTPLHFAVKYSMVECVKELVHLGSDVHHLNKHGLSPLDLSYQDAKGNSDAEKQIFKYLVLEGNNIDINDLFGRVVKMNRKMAKILIDCGVDISVIGADKLIISEFFVDDEEDFFRCLVKCLPVLQRLVSFDVLSFVQGDLLASTLSDAIEIKLIPGENGISMAVHEKEFKNMRCKVPHRLSLCSIKEPLLGIIYNRVVDELKDYNDVLSIDYDYDSFIRYQQRSFTKSCLLKWKKQLWYEKMVSKPLTLQHFCRFTIRKNICCSNFKLIKTLPLPERLISYLLFEWGD